MMPNLFSFKHPNIIAAAILSVGMIVSALLLCSSLHSLNRTIDEKPIGGASLNVPPEFTVHVRNDINSPIHVNVENHRVGQDVEPLLIQQKP